MASTTRIRKSIVEARVRLGEGREKLRKQHDGGTPGIQVCNHLADLVDGIVLEVYEQALEDLPADRRQHLASSVALVAHGGYGRRDQAPFSDVDLMLVKHKAAEEKDITYLAKRLVCDLSDVGLPPGFCVRSVREACQMALKDPVILTSQAEARFLGGSVRVFSQFMQRFRRKTMRRAQALMHEIIDARRAERKQYGETVFLLEPNLKRSKGGLRDTHLLRWIGFARYGESDPSRLRHMGVLSADDERPLRRAIEFLLRLRNEMHFHAGRASDVLYRAEQVRIAELWNYPETEGLLPVEAFMREYFSHTSRIRDTVEYFRACSQKYSTMKRAIDPLFTHRRDGHFRVGPWHIGVSRRARVLLKNNLAEVLRLMDLANQTDSLIEHSTWKAIRDDMMGQSDWSVTEEAARRFMSLLTYTPRLGNLLRRLHELGVLEKLITGMDHARCLLQFNNYHKYTVDEHCLRAVERAVEFLQDGGTLGEVYRQLADRSALHLALLIHDLGKGFTRDHSELGAEMAEETCRRLRLTKQQTEMVVFLVRYHLLMSHLAFRRDTSIDAEIVNFASQVGSPEKLRMLLIMTPADLAAVGPGVLNPWKVDVLVELYEKTLDHLSGGRSRRGRPGEVTRREKLHLMTPAADQKWYHCQIESLPPAYIMERTPEEVFATLQALRDLPEHRAVVEAKYLPDRGATEYTVAMNEQLVRGVFHRMTGVLTSSGLQILAAQIYTLADGLILDRFQVDDGDYEGEPPADRLQSVCHELVKTLEKPSEAAPTFRNVWRSKAQQREVPLLVMPTRVVIDNSFFPEYTVIDVFTHDRLGLLYAIAKTLYEHDTSVHFAKIGTFLDQVVDVFYVTDAEGQKIDDEDRLERIQQAILGAIENLNAV